MDPGILAACDVQMKRVSYLLLGTILMMAALNPWNIGGFCGAAHAGQNLHPAVSIEDSGGADPRAEDPASGVYQRIKTAAVHLLGKLGIDLEFAKLYATWIVGAPTLVVAILIAMMLRPRRKKKPPSVIRRPIQIAPGKKVRTSAVDMKKPMPSTDKERVLEMFIQLVEMEQKYQDVEVLKFIDHFDYLTAVRN